MQSKQINTNALKTFSKILTIFIISSFNSIFAYNHNPSKEKIEYNKAGCAPSTARLKMEFNNVRAIIEPAGILWSDKSEGTAGYEVPKSTSGTPNPKTIYSGSLWIGGKDNNGQLKLAAQLYRRGIDFWTGPLSVDANTGNYNPNQPEGNNTERSFGDATISSSECVAFDKIYTIRKAEVIKYNTWWECKNTNPSAEGCDNIEISNDILNQINNWPAHGDITKGQDFYLAPFYDNPKGKNGKDGIYNPTDGDYPWYDDILGNDEIACGLDRRNSLKGDETHWWVFNDKGNIHTESNGDPIGVEIRAQAFSFLTNDELNDMTFYNYEIINRSTQTINDTYFAQFLDPDLGGYADDYIGCDVSRGLAYCFNGDNFDDPQNGNPSFGANPPAIGIDFFAGPYQDADGKDNPGPFYATINGTYSLITPTVSDAIAQKGIVYNGLGVGYSDRIIDNERLGMTGFTYFYGQGGSNSNQTDPSTATDFYNYMTGKWKDGSSLYYGGTGYQGSSGATSISTNFMFPDDSDPLHWGTKGNNPGFNWSESTNVNYPGDRRFIQSAGPFTLKPGAVNNVTIGVVYARSYDGDLLASVRELKRIDSKAQALFDNCFNVLEPPMAPRLNVVENENQLVLLIDNPKGSNNYNESYRKEDKINIIDENNMGFNKFYDFEGYQIFQVIDENVTAENIFDKSKARLVAQCDVQNTVAEITNYEFNVTLKKEVPISKVKGENKGIKHSFIINKDYFSNDTTPLNNHKEYHYIAVSYSHNNYKNYDPNSKSGQKTPYIYSKLNFEGGNITPVSGIPHKDYSSDNLPIEYGYSPEITRLDGVGNGNNWLELTNSSLDKILLNGALRTPTYKAGKGPLNIKVIDPLNFVKGYFECKFIYPESDIAKQGNNLINKGTDTAQWVVYRFNNSTDRVLLDSIVSEQSIKIKNNQIIPEWGISIEIFQSQYYYTESTGPQQIRYMEPIGSSIEFKDTLKPWLSFIHDNSSFTPENWIMSGDFVSNTAQCNPADPITNPCFYNDEKNRDNEDRAYSNLLDGGIAPHALTRFRSTGIPLDFMPLVYPYGTNHVVIRNRAAISRMPNVDIVITADTSMWTRCVVVEIGSNTNLNIGQVEAGKLRGSASVDKLGRPLNDNTKGMGWFPGYAIDIETGMRLNMAFGENSFLVNDNGSDMIWNPTDRLYNNVGNHVFGGQHPIYIFGYNLNGENDPLKICPYYDENDIESKNWVYNRFLAGNFTDIYSNLTWIVNPILKKGQKLMSCDVKLKVRVKKEYNDFVATNLNKGRPLYSWDMNEISTIGFKNEYSNSTNNISVFPNPTSETIYIKQVENLDNFLVEIYNEKGQKVKEKMFIGNTSISTENLKNGNYFIHLVNLRNYQTTIKKIIVINK